MSKVHMLLVCVRLKKQFHHLYTLNQCLVGGLICSIIRKINKEKLSTDLLLEKDREIQKLKEQVERLQKQKFFSPKRN